MLKLISANSKVLLGLFLTARNVTDEMLLECQYPPPLFLNINDPMFLKDNDELTQVMDFKQTWFSKFHAAIAFDSVQSLMEDMVNVRISCTPGEMILMNIEFKYTSNLVIIYQDASKFTCKKCDKLQLNKAARPCAGLNIHSTPNLRVVDQPSVPAALSTSVPPLVLVIY